MLVTTFRISRTRKPLLPRKLEYSQRSATIGVPPEHLGEQLITGRIDPFPIVANGLRAQWPLDLPHFRITHLIRLHRTGGRLMYHAGMRIEVIGKIFWHTDTKATTRYLGLDLDDMSDSFSQYAEYMNCPKNGKFWRSQSNWWTERDL